MSTKTVALLASLLRIRQLASGIIGPSFQYFQGYYNSSEQERDAYRKVSLRLILQKMGALDALDNDKGCIRLLCVPNIRTWCVKKELLVVHVGKPFLPR